MCVTHHERELRSLLAPSPHEKRRFEHFLGLPYFFSLPLGYISTYAGDLDCGLERVCLGQHRLYMKSRVEQFDVFIQVRRLQQRVFSGQTAIALAFPPLLGFA